MKYNLLYFKIISITLFLVVSITSCTLEKENGHSGTIKVALREAGNQLLLRKLDSTSLILPIKELKPQVYLISFEKPISFEPSDVVTVIDSSLNLLSLSKNYRVEVVQCTDGEVAYSYQMNIEEEQTIIPCAGRNLPKACYHIKVEFLEIISQSSFKKRWTPYVLIFGILMYAGFLYLRKFKKQPISEEKNSSYSSIGSFQFYPEQNKLVKSATEISLSKKECELLEIFVANPNQIIKREALTKKVWEDNGVFVSRSLDTYISKLRKKLKDDDSIRISNIHGVGYKLEVDDVV
ncbi:winged helix-turn-helix domain-containing protein [Psychroserpens sp. Hel_I_66]|uniref:winged helix-turn-helix domain-containing protein n=1 Tax=Psychroserpens sp. Hel_I_66 TaxID=1250004 RepID=UPI000646E05F|nr:winged helix-turn-helix domain-containing protein [Psychroserpens sp. Hel_I_66]